jgi:hypothetical protein
VQRRWCWWKGELLSLLSGETERRCCWTIVARSATVTLRKLPDNHWSWWYQWLVMKNIFHHCSGTKEMKVERLLHGLLRGRSCWRVSAKPILRDATLLLGCWLNEGEAAEQYPVREGCPREWALLPCLSLIESQPRGIGTVFLLVLLAAWVRRPEGNTKPFFSFDFFGVTAYNDVLDFFGNVIYSASL